MPVARFQMPDGRIGRFEVPDGTTPEQAQAMISQSLQRQPTGPSTDPTEGMNVLEKLAAGIGRGMTSTGRAALQGISKLVGADSVGAGLVKQETLDQAKKDDAALLNTGAGKVGNVLGMAALAAPTAFIPGANTALGASAIGAGIGGLTTEGGLADRAQGAAFGAAGGLAGKYLGEGLGAGARWIADRATGKAAAAQAANAQRSAAAQAAAGAGYVIPPADLQPGMLTEALSGLSGKIKTAQVASARNQTVTDKLARQAIGLKPGDELSADVLQAIRRQAAARGYDQIKTAGTVNTDQVFSDALDALIATRKGAVRSFPGLGKTNMHGQPVDEIGDLISAVRLKQFDAGDAVDATKVLRDIADKAYRQGDRELGKASKGASDAIEGMLERHLQSTGNPDALAAFQEARKLIAKTYSVQKATNTQTGNVSAQALAKQLEKQKYLSGELRQIAEFGQAFPKATQALKEAPKATSPLDWAVGAMTGASTGNPLTLAMIGARPAARSLLLSPAYQRAALQQSSGPGLLSQMPAGLLDNEMARRMSPGLLAMLAANGITNE